MTSSSVELTTDALIKLGCLVFGQTPTPDLITGGFRIGNAMLDSWLLDELLVFAITPDSYPLTSALSYTIGPTGDFVAQRPLRVENCNYVFTNSNPVVRMPVAILTAAQWSLIGVQNITNAVVNAIFYEGNFTQPDGNGTIHVWPGAPAGNLIELFTWKQLQEFADTGTSYNFPPGYLECMQWCLAEKLIPMARTYFKVGTDAVAEVHAEAQRSKTALQGYNQRDIDTYCDFAYLVGRRSGTRGAFNYLTGGFGRSL